LSRQYGTIFDMDGVLIDSFDLHRRSWQTMAREYGVEVTDEQFASTFGRTSREIIRHFWGENVTPQKTREMDDRKEALFRQFLRRHIPVMPGAVELIDDLAAHGFLVGVGSSGPPENVAMVVDGLGLRDRLAGVITATDVTRGKPDPQVFLLTAERMGIAPDRCAVIEDAVHGITAARRAGMKAVALTGTAGREAFGEADLIVDSLTELTAARLADLIDGRGRP
jgi:beta-phosphoglucomutase